MNFMSLCIEFWLLGKEPLNNPSDSWGRGRLARETSEWKTEKVANGQLFSHSFEINLY